MPLMLSERFVKAVESAHEFHKGHCRKGTEIPYLSHLLALASLVIENGENEDEAIAALLHDAVEDCGGKEAMKKIRIDFGENVAAIVDGCTETDQNPKPPWKERKDKYIAHMRVACASIYRSIGLQANITTSRMTERSRVLIPTTGNLRH